MSCCDKCSCFDDSYAEDMDMDYPKGMEDDDQKQQEWLDDNPLYEPHRYYYWHGDIQEDYQMPVGYECLCEECFGNFLNKGEIIEKYLDHFIGDFLVYTDKQPQKLNPKWNDETMGWFIPDTKEVSK